MMLHCGAMAEESNIGLNRPASPQSARIAVIIPVFNAEATVVQAIASIQAQTVRDIEIIVVDDGSTDATAARLAEIASQDPRVKLVLKTNSGIVDALNLGLSHASADIIARHDADDVAWPERFSKQLAYLDAHPDCVAVSAWVQFIDAQGVPTEDFARHPPPDGDPTLAPAREPFLMHPMLMVRTSAIDAVGRYRHAFHAEDSDLYWRLSEIGRLHILPEVLGYYRMHPASVTSRSVLNGRIAAVTSQLAALDTCRRSAKRPELGFRPEALGRYEAARSLRAMVSLAGENLDPDERRRFEIGAAAKILKLADHRPWELEAADCVFVRQTLGGDLGGLTPANRAALRRQVVEAVRRLRRAGAIFRAGLLLPWRLYPRLAVAMVAPRLRRSRRNPNALDPASPSFVDR